MAKGHELPGGSRGMHPPGNFLKQVRAEMQSGAF